MQRKLKEWKTPCGSVWASSPRGQHRVHENCDKIHITWIKHFIQFLEWLGDFSGVRLTDGFGVPSAFFPEEHSKAWWPCRSYLSSSLSPAVLGHLSVCHLRISLSTLLLGLCFGKFLRLPWVLRRQAWIPGSPLLRACRVEMEAEGRLSCGGLCGVGVSGPPLLWRGRETLCMEPGETWQGQSSESRSLFNLCLHLVTYSFHCFLGVGNIYGRTQYMPGTASCKRRRNSSAECRAE